MTGRHIIWGSGAGNRYPDKFQTAIPTGFFIGLIFLFSGFAYAGQNDQASFHLDDIVVTGFSIPAELSKATRSMTVIDSQEIAALPVNNIADLLETVSGVDVRQRGGFGIQADVSIRGGSFEQTLILVDGINVSDPQTGHHNMNLPVALDDIERIEIVKGPGARAYGHNAMTGVINIITRDADQTRAGAGAAGGQNGFYRLDGRVQGKTGLWSNRLSAGKRASSGYLPNRQTDFDIRTVNYAGGIKGNAHDLKLGVGYTENDFGAYGFYSDVYPDQREKTKTLLAHGGSDIRIGHVLVSPKAFWRKNQDDFFIDINGDRLHNAHQSDAYGASAGAGIDSALGKTAVGGEVARETLASLTLGDHDRSRYGMFLEQKIFPVENVSLGAGASAMKYTNQCWAYWPGADIRVSLAPKTIGYASAAKSYRVPTYTEMYYDNPANKGNPDLKPENAYTSEIGVRTMKNGFGSTVNIFFRDAENLIDWTRKPGETVWTARNISSSRTRGLELGMDLYPGVLWDMAHNTVLNLSYTLLDTDFDAGGFESKYALNQLRHQIDAGMRINWSGPWIQTLHARYQQRRVSDSHVIIDTRLAFDQKHWKIYCDVSNMTDASYVDNGFASAPGRWMIAGVSFDFL